MFNWQLDRTNPDILETFNSSQAIPHALKNKGRVTSNGPVRIDKVFRPNPHRGTAPYTYKPTYQDDEKATFHSICAMTAYAGKSPEEIRMEDYSENHGNQEAFGEQAFPQEQSSVLPSTNPIELEPMDYELLRDEFEDAIHLVNRIVAKIENDLSTDQWKGLAPYVSLNWNTLKDQLLRLLLKWKKWVKEGKQYQFSIGYHFSLPSQMNEIRQTGLLTKADRLAAGVSQNDFALAMGDGVYTGNNPLEFYEFRTGATEGMMLLRLVGKADFVYACDESIDTIVSQGRGIVNLRQSDQCAVLLEYAGDARYNPGIIRLQDYFEDLIDQFFSNQANQLASQSEAHPSKSLVLKTVDIYRAIHNRTVKREFRVVYNAPQTLRSVTSMHGTSPSGILSVAFDPRRAWTGSPPGTIILEFDMSWGIQKAYHRKRGEIFDSHSKTAYIPDGRAGCQLLQRVVYAFLHGLLFEIGGTEDKEIVWFTFRNSSCVQYGHPVRDYISTCEANLDSVGVPAIGDPRLHCAGAEELMEFAEARWAWMENHNAHSTSP